MTTTIVQTARSEADSSFTAFQGNNAFGSSELFIGNIFFGIQASFVTKFTPNLPKRAEIISATIDLTSVDTRSGSVPININASRSGAHKFPSFGPAWRSEIWGRFKALVKDTGGGTLINTVPGNPGLQRLLKETTTKRLRLGQVIVPTASGTLGSIDIRGSRTGIPAPSGNVFLQIVASDPDGPVLAQSDNVLAASFPTTLGIVSFPFSGANQIVLQAGVTYHIIMDATYPAGTGQNVLWNQLSQFFSVGGARHYGTGLDWDNQNYPGQADAYLEATGGTSLGTDIFWLLPAFLTGVAYTTPELKTLFQEIVDNPTYDSGDGISIAFKAASAPSQRRVAAYDHATLAPPTLVIEWVPGTFDHIPGDGRITQRISDKGIVTQRISDKGIVTQRIAASAPVTQRIIGKGLVAQRITK